MKIIIIILLLIIWNLIDFILWNNKYNFSQSTLKEKMLKWFFWTKY